MLLPLKLHNFGKCCHPYLTGRYAYGSSVSTMNIVNTDIG